MENSPLGNSLAVERLNHLDEVDILEKKSSTELVANSLARVGVEDGGAWERSIPVQTRSEYWHSIPFMVVK